MLYCPRCKKLFLDDGGVCPFDGAALVRPPDPLMGQQVGSYLLLNLLGQGGMGKVYKAEHVFIGKPFAVKVLHPKFAAHKDIVERFLFEARAAARINHPNIVEITDFGYTNDYLPFFVMELMEGRELVDIIDNDAPIPLFRAINILVQVCRALSACHDENIVHQDLKPENIFLVQRKGRRKIVELLDDPANPFRLEDEDSYDLVKILDFGVAHLAQLVSANTIAGTPEYMAPEQAQGIKGDRRSDIYSAGIILYEMLTGEIPFNGETPEEVFHNVFTKSVPRISEKFDYLQLPAQIDDVLARALALKPEHRYQSFAEFESDLRKCYGRTFYSRDIPAVLKKDQGPDIDAKLKDDLESLFSGGKRKSSQDEIRRVSSENLRRVSSGNVKKISPENIQEVSTSGKRKISADEIKKPIDPNLAKDLSDLFGSPPPKKK
ncbi:serine/threonine protein kinase [Myxococcota bacterium]|nr:serine/threonine protein kinase [Myxococcota bacterium]MBU1381010.1 serine/threonine protein kinase [Myxococcota bacterium]